MAKEFEGTNNVIEANTDNGQTENGGNVREKALAKIQRRWFRFSTSKGGRWAIRIGKAGLIGLGLKAAYDYGKKSAEPTVVTVTPITPEPETQNLETPAEEATTQE